MSLLDLDDEAFAARVSGAEGEELVGLVRDVLASASEREVVALLDRLTSTLEEDQIAALMERLSATASLEENFTFLSAFVGSASKEQLVALVESPELRDRLLREIFTRMADQFRSDRAEDLDAVVHWKIFDRPGGGYDHFELVIEDGQCTLSKKPRHDPRVTFRMKPIDFLRLVTGHAGGLRLALRGRLQVVGDLNFARRVNGLFEIPDE